MDPESPDLVLMRSNKTVLMFGHLFYHSGATELYWFVFSLTSGI